jgi:hypothetical protein
LNPIFKLSTQVHPAFSSSQRFDDSRQFFSTQLSATMMRISALFITGAAALRVDRSVPKAIEFLNQADGGNAPPG